MKAALHLGESCNDKLVTYEKTNFEAVKNVVRRHADIDIEPEARDQARLHD